MTKESKMKDETNREKGFLRLAGFLLVLGLFIGGPSPSFVSSARAEDGAVIECADPELEEKIKESIMDRRNLEEISLFKSFGDFVDQLAGGRFKGVSGDIGDLYCINDLVYLHGRLMSFLSLDYWVALIVNAILEMLERILDQVCQIIKTAINSLMNLICLPIPQLSLPDFNLGGIKGVTCDGISLADFVQIRSAPRLNLGRVPMPDGYMSLPISRRPREMGLGNIFGQ